MGHCLFKIATFFDASMASYKDLEGKQVEVKSDKLKQALKLDYEFRDLRTSLVEAGYEVIKRGHVQDLIHKSNPRSLHRLLGVVTIRGFLT